MNQKRVVRPMEKRTRWKVHRGGRGKKPGRHPGDASVINEKNHKEKEKRNTTRQKFKIPVMTSRGQQPLRQRTEGEVGGKHPMTNPGGKPPGKTVRGKKLQLKETSGIKVPEFRQDKRSRQRKRKAGRGKLRRREVKQVREKKPDSTQKKGIRRTKHLGGEIWKNARDHICEKMGTERLKKKSRFHGRRGAIEPKHRSPGNGKHHDDSKKATPCRESRGRGKNSQEEKKRTRNKSGPTLDRVTLKFSGGTETAKGS